MREMVIKFFIWLFAAHSVARYDDGWDQEKEGSMLYYSDGGPGPAARLLRVDAPKDASIDQWRRAPAQRWSVKAGWKSEPMAQLDIEQTGDYFMVDQSQVADIQKGMKAQYELR